MKIEVVVVVTAPPRRWRPARQPVATTGLGIKGVAEPRFAG
ncbi:hypothetical protein [Mesorhizobium sp.]|nr:hypothetical protein [Mesorhizobium sp.]